MGHINIIESFANFYELPPDDQKTINNAIEMSLTNSAVSSEWREGLIEALGKHRYTGENPKVALKLYDILGGKSKKALSYGISGFETLEREPITICTLENPDNLVKYTIDTSESLEELVGLKDSLLSEGNFFHYDSRWSDSYRKPKQNLINSLLMVSFEIADKLKDIDIRNRSVEYETYEELREYNDKWRKRVDAYAAIVLCYQAKGKKPDNKDALNALRAYEELTGTYDGPRFHDDLMKTYAKIKYGADKPVYGEISEDLKADPDSYVPFLKFPGFDYFFRAEYFGTKKSYWEKVKEGKGKEEKEKFEEYIDDLLGLGNHWERHAVELNLLGVNKEMSFEEARSIYRRIMKQQSVTFSRQDIGTSEYRSAMEKAAQYTVAWSKIEPLFKINMGDKTSK